MRLGYLLQYIDNTLIPIEKNTSRKDYKNTHRSRGFKPYVLFSIQQSYDPRVCLVRSKYPVGDKSNILKSSLNFPEWFKEGNDYAYLMNIYVNFQQILSSVNDNLDEEGNLSLFDFLSSLCTP
jgi:hypothetical protein